MALKMAIWRMTENGPVALHFGSLDLERRLEDMIVADPSLTGIELLVVGQQVRTDFGGNIDVLAVDVEGRIHVLELKRDRTPRGVVAQVLDYGSWVRDLTLGEVKTIYAEHHDGTFDERWTDRPRRPAQALARVRFVASTQEMILNGDPGQAYVSFRSKGIGPAFYTKWFWAAGLAQDLSPTPLILDARVWASLGALGWDSRQSAGIRRWRDRYLAYLNSMEGWTGSDLPGVNDAEHLEQMLFQWAGG